MSLQPDPHSVRRVVLPSGKTIEVIYFNDPPAGLQPHEAPATGGLHVCPDCASPLVQPAEWHEAGSGHWEMTLRCPDCEWLGGGIFAQGLVERLEEELDRGTEALVRDLRRLVQANMSDEIERFVTALHEDQILPMDF